MTKAFKRRACQAISIALVAILASFSLMEGASAYAADLSIWDDPGTEEVLPINQVGSAVFDAEGEDSDEPEVKNTVSLLAVGDNLVHPHIRNCAKKAGKGKYDFNSLYANLLEDIQAADIAVINQETVFTSGNYSGFPRFATPYEISDAIDAAGFDVVQHANNHCMDKGTKVLANTLKHWKNKHSRITVLGAYLSKKDSETVRVLEVNGIRIAMLNYSKSTNGIKVSAKKKYMVDLLTNKTKMASDIKKAKAISDFVVVFMHDGTEYKTTPVSMQKKHAKWFAEHGVDLVIGTHPHVIEPVRWVSGKNGHKMLCYYSLGNYVANHNTPTLARIMGGMARVEITKDEKGARISKCDMVPLVMHKGSVKDKRGYTVYKMADYTEQMAKENPFRDKIGKSLTLKSLKKKYRDITGLEIIR